MRLHLQLKLLADIGLVGLPNAGKSSLVRALTGLGTEVGSWAFTTLNPSVGVVKVWPGGGFGAAKHRGPVVETIIEQSHRDEALKLGLESSEDVEGAEEMDLKEDFRFTISDNPGLIEDASQNVGLGHSFLKSIERSKALVYVVDLSVEDAAGTATEAPPEQALRTLREELELYKEGLSKNARLVIANKADLLVPSIPGSDSTSNPPFQDEEAESRAKARLAKLTSFAREEFGIEVIPISAKWGMNLEAVVRRMREYVEEARKREAGEEDPEEILIEREVNEPLRIS